MKIQERFIYVCKVHITALGKLVLLWLPMAENISNYYSWEPEDPVERAMYGISNQST